MQLALLLLKQLSLFSLLLTYLFLPSYGIRKCPEIGCHTFHASNTSSSRFGCPALWIKYGIPFLFLLSEMIPMCMVSKVTISPGCHSAISSKLLVSVMAFRSKYTFRFGTRRKSIFGSGFWFTLGYEWTLSPNICIHHFF